MLRSALTSRVPLLRAFASARPLASTASSTTTTSLFAAAWTTQTTVGAAPVPAPLAAAQPCAHFSNSLGRGQSRRRVRKLRERAVVRETNIRERREGVQIHLENLRKRRARRAGEFRAAAVPFVSLLCMMFTASRALFYLTLPCARCLCEVAYTTTRRPYR
jgi:hypothetical protein